MIVTGDRDAFQIIDPESRVRVMATGRGITDTKLYDHQAVIDRYGIAPELIPDFYGLKGDTSDNIPGVPGIGDKTAADLLQRFGDLETILASVDEISGAKRKENLTNHADDARMSKVLATIRATSPVDVDPIAEAARAPDRSRLREVFREFELRAPLRRLEEALGDQESAAPLPVEEHTVRVRLREGTRRRPAHARPGGLGGHRRGDRPRRARGPAARRRADVALRRRGGRGRARRAVRAPRGRRRARSATAPSSPTTPRRWAIVPPNLAHDTLLGAYLLEPARRGFPFREICEERGLGADCADDAGRDAALLQALAAWQREQIAERGLQMLLTEIELPLVRVLREMEIAGVRLDKERIAEVDARVREEVHGLEREIWDARRRGVRDRLAPAARRDPVREARAVAQAPRQDRLLHRRARAAGDPRRARDHPQDRALARAQPDRQDLPRRAAAAGRRRLAHPHDVRAGGRHHRPPGLDEPEHAERAGAHRAGARDPRLLRGRARRWCSPRADYSQVELRILAHVAGEEVLKEIFVRGEDVHTATASQVFGRAPEDLTPMDRSKAKMINYGIVYGLSDYGLADRLNIPRDEAKAFIDAYLERFGAVARVHGRHDRAGQGAGPRDDALRPPPADPRAAGPQLPGAHAGRAPGGQHRHPGHRGRRDEARDDRACTASSPPAA